VRPAQRRASSIHGTCPEHPFLSNPTLRGHIRAGLRVHLDCAPSSWQFAQPSGLQQCDVGEHCHGVLDHDPQKYIKKKQLAGTLDAIRKNAKIARVHRQAAT
jgi:hypothetical protein